MARLFTEGFEMGDFMFLDSFTGAVSVTTDPRSGNYCLGCINGTPTKNIPSLSEFYIRFAWKCNNGGGATSPIMYFRANTTNLVTVGYNNLNRLYVQVGSTIVATGNVTYGLGTWILLELYIKIADSGGRIVVKMDGNDTGIDYTGDTKPGADTAVNNIMFTHYNAAAYEWYDDLALNDTTGTEDNSWCGDGHVVAYFPNGNGDSAQMTGSDGNSTDNYLLVDEKPTNNDTDYVESSTIDQYDLYHIQDASLTNQTILRVWVESRSKDTVAEGGKLALGVKPNGGSEAWSSDLNLLTAYNQIKSDGWKTNPSSSSAWTDSDLDGLQIGVKAR